MTAQAEGREEELVEGKVSAPKLPRILVSLGIVGVIAGSIWALSGGGVPFIQSAPPPCEPVEVAAICARVADQIGRPTAPRLGQLAPDFEWQEPGGERRRLSDLRGSVVVLNWWATWCGPCKAEMPALQRAARSEPGVVVLAVDWQEDEPRVVDFVRRLELADLKVVIDPNGETARRYALAALPQTFFIDPSGVIRHLELGGPMDDEAIRKGIAKAR
jgi:cytochrome c biogenesis protein CcmG/thiol:disulfide interchange protein DsbE